MTNSPEIPFRLFEHQRRALDELYHATGNDTYQAESRLHRTGKPVPLRYIGVDLSTEPDEKHFAISMGGGWWVRATYRRYVAHERLCVPAVRARRTKEGKPPAAWVMDNWRLRQRVAKFKPDAPGSRKEDR